jgi:hypothetical protein
MYQFRNCVHALLYVCYYLPIFTVRTSFAGEFIFLVQLKNLFKIIIIFIFIQYHTYFTNFKYGTYYTTVPILHTGICLKNLRMVPVTDINISREQAIFRHSGDTWTITDQSSNGVR